MTTAILVTARLKSTRLPLKVLKSIVGRPMIAHMLDRLKRAQRPNQIILCTSRIAQDDPLEEVARVYGVECFRGDPDDVLMRIRDAARAFGVDTIISCTADNPFVDPIYIDRLVDYHCAADNDFTRIIGLPFGVFSYALKRAAVERACDLKAERDTEVWGGYFTQTGLFRTGELTVTEAHLRRPELRLTVDTPEDLLLVRAIFEELHEEGRVFSLDEIVRLLDARPELLALNAHVRQKPGKPIRLRHDAQHSADRDCR